MTTNAVTGNPRSSQPDSSTVSHSAVSAAGAILQPAAAQPGQPLLLFPQQAHVLGAPSEVASLLRARGQALDALKAAQQRLDEFNALILQTNDVRDDEKGSVIHLLLSKIPLLPETARADALRDAATLAGGAAADELPGLCAQLARTVGALAPGERPAALRSALLRAGSLPPDGRGLPLPALAAALSSLHDPGAQQALLDMLCSLMDKSPDGQRPAALEQLVAVSWLSDTVRWSAHMATVQRLPGSEIETASRILTRLTADMAKLPKGARLDAFHGLLKLCAGMPDSEKAALLTALDDAVESLPDALQVAARNAVLDAGAAGMPRPAPAGAALHAGEAQPTRVLGYTGYTNALAAACKRSPANRKAVLEELSVELGALPPHQRSPALYAWLNAASHPSAAARAALLARIVQEIRMLPDHLRLAAWNKVQAAAVQLPENHRSEPLAALAHRIADLPDGARLPALQSLLSAAAGVVSFGNAVAQAVAGAIAWLPEHQRTQVFQQMAGLIRHKPQMAPALAANLIHLPAERRHAAFQLLAAGCSVSTNPLFAALALALPAMPESALPSAIMRLLRIESSFPGAAEIVRGLDRCSVHIPIMALHPLLPWFAKRGTTLEQNANAIGWRSLMKTATLLLLRQPRAHWEQLALTDKHLNPPGVISCVANICLLVSSGRHSQQLAKEICEMDTPHRYYLEELLVLPDAVLDQVLIRTAVSPEAIDRMLASGLSTKEKTDHLVRLIASPDKEKVPMENWLHLHNAIVQWTINGGLPPKQASAMLVGQGQPADDKSLFRSNALLTALHNSKAAFVDAYAMTIAGAPLPDEFKLAILSGRDAKGSNEKEIKACMKAADAATREAFERQVSMSPLAETVKQDLLRYC